MNYFEGFETYTIDPDPTDADFMPRLSGQTQPSGLTVVASSMFVLVSTPHPAFLDNQGFQYSPAVPHSRTVTVDAPWNADRDAGVHQVLMDGRAPTSRASSSRVTTCPA